MIEYKALDRIEVSGRGTIFIIENDKDRDFYFKDLIGQSVIIDNKEIKVKDAYKFAIQTIKRGMLIGILGY